MRRAAGYGSFSEPPADPPMFRYTVSPPAIFSGKRATFEHDDQEDWPVGSDQDITLKEQQNIAPPGGGSMSMPAGTTLTVTILDRKKLP